MSEPIPVRPRARTVTPVRVTLFAVLLLAAGFIGGVEVQKRSGDSSTPTSFAGRFAGAGAATRGFGGGGGASSDPGSASGATVGQVANVHGRTLYVTESGGTTVKVRTTAQTKVTRTAVSRVRAVHPGDTVIVQGSTSSSGTVRAARVTATASNAASGLLGGGGGFGGFGGATAPGG
jgi:hypothetical protein